MTRIYTRDVTCYALAFAVQICKEGQVGEHMESEEV